MRTKTYIQIAIVIALVISISANFIQRDAMRDVRKHRDGLVVEANALKEDTAEYGEALRDCRERIGELEKQIARQSAKPVRIFGRNNTVNITSAPATQAAGGKIK